VKLEMQPRDMSMVTEAGDPIIAEESMKSQWRRATEDFRTGVDEDFPGEGTKNRLNKCRKVRKGRPSWVRPL
jgi:hypothetical protein